MNKLQSPHTIVEESFIVVLPTYRVKTSKEQASCAVSSTKHLKPVALYAAFYTLRWNCSNKIIFATSGMSRSVSGSSGLLIMSQEGTITIPPIHNISKGKTDHGIPSHTFFTLIVQAILSTDYKQMYLGEIYLYIAKCYSFSSMRKNVIKAVLDIICIRTGSGIS